MRGIVLMVALLVASPLAAQLARADTETFEDFSIPFYDQLPQPYHGKWYSENLYVINKYALPGTGYEYGTLGQYAVFNGWGAPATLTSSSIFSLMTISFASAWNDSNQIQVEGLLNGMPVLSTTVTAHSRWSQLFHFDNFTGINGLRFTSTSSQFVMDNLTYDHGDWNSQPPGPGAQTPELPAPMLMAASMMLIWSLMCSARCSGSMLPPCREFAAQ